MNKIKNDQSFKRVAIKKIGRPRKLLAQLSPAYRKRLQSGKAKGLSRSQAYGGVVPFERTHYVLFKGEEI